LQRKENKRNRNWPPNKSFEISTKEDDIFRLN